MNTNKHSNVIRKNIIVTYKTKETVMVQKLQENQSERMSFILH